MWYFPTTTNSWIFWTPFGCSNISVLTLTSQLASNSTGWAQSQKNVATSDTLLQVPLCHGYFWLISSSGNPLLRFQLVGMTSIIERIHPRNNQMEEMQMAKCEWEVHGASTLQAPWCVPWIGQWELNSTFSSSPVFFLSQQLRWEVREAESSSL